MYLQVRGNISTAVNFSRKDVYKRQEHAVAYVQSTRHLQDDIVSFLKQHDDELDSMDIVVKDEAQKQKVIEVLKAEVEDIYITSSISQLVEISYKDAGKRSGVKFITEYLGLNPKQVRHSAMQTMILICWNMQAAALLWKMRPMDCLRWQTW